MKRDELRKYLLGELSEDPADQLDACLFSGDDLHRDLQDELEKLLGAKVDLGTESMLRPRVRETILAEAVTL